MCLSNSLRPVDFPLFLLPAMRSDGFDTSDYNIMQKSCNSFTEELSRRLGVSTRYPSSVLNQSRLADMLSPVAKALDLVSSAESMQPSSSRSLLSTWLISGVKTDDAPH